MKLSLREIRSGFRSALSLNDNFQRIKDVLQNKVLWRDNPSGEPNEMKNNLDMNSNDILNAGAIRAESFEINQEQPGFVGYKETGILEAGGDFNEDVRVSAIKIGEFVSLRIFTPGSAVIQHSNQAEVTSAVGVLPEDFRPVDQVVYVSALAPFVNAVQSVGILADGSVTLTYTDVSDFTAVPSAAGFSCVVQYPIIPEA